MKTEGDNYLSALIHKNFYFNDHLDAATMIKEYARIEQILVNAQYIACLTLQIEQLKKIEYLYGSMVYNHLLAAVTDQVKRMKNEIFRQEDILVVDLFDQDTFIIFLSPPRDKNTRVLEHLEGMAERARKCIEVEIFNLFYPHIKEYAKPGVGYGMVINNPMVSHMRLIMQLVAGSRQMGHFMALKQEQGAKFQLQKIVIEEDIHTVYQPIVEMKNLDILGYEALSRGPVDSEFRNPMLLFLVAAEFGLSFELDSLCRRKAISNIRNLGTNKKIFINTLAITIHDPQFRGRYLEKLLEDIKLKPENVIFEINEKMAIDNYDLFRTALKDYSDIGIVHANDDVGAAYSDLERIMELNPGFMKLDISLVRGINKSHIKQQIIKAMVNMAKGLGSQIIAEGIETPEEYETLLALDVDYGQGYLFGKPCPDLEDINRSWR
ncbi:MAG: EAL domain-containing protein [Gammaproteobacteria bacterium]|nr:EAL domain-containing protein [Gammaproteobacteria bacterium]